jgi:hypothetical protein
VCLEASTKPHVHSLIHELLINMAFTMACPNFKKGLKMVSRPLGVNHPAPVDFRGPPLLKTPIPHSNPRILYTQKEIWIQNEIRLILDAWLFNNPAPVDFRGSPCLRTPIPPSNPQILNTHKEIWDQNEIGLILDVW